MNKSGLMFEKPAQIWVLPEELDAPRKLSTDDVALIEYEDTGWEPQLDYLYETISCDCVDRRVLPGLGVLWFDDTGRLTNRKPNPVASALYELCCSSTEGILGTAVLIVDPVASTEAPGVIEYLYRRIKIELLAIAREQN